MVDEFDREVPTSMDGKCLCQNLPYKCTSQYLLSREMKLLLCVADRMEENGGSMPTLDLPPAEIRNLEQIAKVSTCDIIHAFIPKCLPGQQGGPLAVNSQQ